ncbi:MAG: hydrogenase maturation nickel metallochaperone HypA [Deltaproteobacteria bacterium]|nr:hydrogenase maturation nickel metallochaperone HypA [Candidatus Tharpella sp.]
MHELPVIENILKTVLAHAAKHRVRKVVAIHLEVGELSDLEDQWMQRYFDHLSKGSRAEKAHLAIKRVPAMLQCDKCGEIFPFTALNDEISNCPACAGNACRLIAGQGYFINNIEVV